MKHPTLKFPSLLAPVALAFALLLAIAVPGAFAMDADTLAGTTLVLRGTGTRTEGTQALYTARLYAAPGAADVHQLQVVMARDVEAAEITALLARGLVANATEEELSRLIPELFGLGAVIGAQHRLRAGDSFQIIGNADRSTTVRVHSRAAPQPLEATFAHPELFAVMLKLWLGPQPADSALKQALLGRPA